jgi:hypothetical protein
LENPFSLTPLFSDSRRAISKRMREKTANTEFLSEDRDHREDEG